MKNLIIFDADSIIWTVAYKFRNKKVKNLMLISLNNFIGEVIQNTKATHYLGYFGSKEAGREPNFRYAVDVNYKAQRPPEPDWITKWRPVICNEMEEKWGFIGVEGLEADDAVAFTAAHFKDEYDEIIIAAVDKDLKQIPNITYYNYTKHTSEKTNEFSCANELGIQMLAGDTADNIKGLYKIGPIKAKKHLSICKTITEIKWSVMRMYYAHEEDLRKKITKELTKLIKTDIETSEWAKGKSDKQIERQVRITLIDKIDKEMESKMPGGWKAYYKIQYKLLKLLDVVPDNFDMPDPVESSIAVAADIADDDFLFL